MVWIEPGAFTMGSPEGEIDDGDNDEPLRRVVISRGYWIGEYEVTVGEWKAFVDAVGYVSDSERLNTGIRIRAGDTWKWDTQRSWRDPGFFQDDTHPVVGLSWNDAMAFCEWLTNRDAREGRLPEGYAYSLPSEAEWEYACRAGTETPFAFGNSLNPQQGNFSPNNGDVTFASNGELIRTEAVASNEKNVWGLSDMHGNVWEWCLDWYGPYDLQELEDPQGQTVGAKRVKRGGCWSSSASHCRSANRNRDEPSYCHSGIGFRLSLRNAENP